MASVVSGLQAVAVSERGGRLRVERPIILEDTFYFKISFQELVSTGEAEHGEIAGATYRGGLASIMLQYKRSEKWVFD